MPSLLLPEAAHACQAFAAPACVSASYYLTLLLDGRFVLRGLRLRLNVRAELQLRSLHLLLLSHQLRRRHFRCPYPPRLRCPQTSMAVGETKMRVRAHARRGGGVLKFHALAPLAIASAEPRRLKRQSALGRCSRDRFRKDHIIALHLHYLPHRTKTMRCR